MKAPFVVLLDPALDIPAPPARSGQDAAPISAVIVAKNDSAATPSRQDPMLLVLALISSTA
jgi:hypothetical protein